MFSSLRRLVGLIGVRESGDLITLSGLPGDTVQQSVYDIWNNHKVATNVFTHLGNSEVTFNRFFAPDVAYIFNRIIQERRKGHNIRALKRTVTLMYEDTWLKDTLIKHPDILNYGHLSELNVTMMDKQMEFFRIYNDLVPRYKLKGYLLGADPGTGKTLMGIGLSLCLGADIVICIVPKNSVHRVWADTLETRFKRVPKYWTSLDGDEPAHDDKYLICHFDALEKLLAILRNRSSHKPVVVLDESHGLNEFESMRTQLFIEMCRMIRCENVLWSSGTPIKAIGREATPLFSTIDPFFDHDAQVRFQAIYGKTAARANDILAHRMGKVHYHINKKDVVNNEVQTHTIEVKLANGNDYTLQTIKGEMTAFVKERVQFYQKNMRHYEHMWQDTMTFFEKTLSTPEQWKNYKLYRNYIKQIRKGFDPRKMRDMSIYCNHYEKKVIMPTLPKELRDTFKSLRSIIKYYMLKVQGEALGRVLGQARPKCHVDMLTKGVWFKKTGDELEPFSVEQIIDTALKKTIIFTSYVDVVDAANEFLRKEGYQPILVYGKTNNELATHVGNFEREPDANPLCATFDSLSTAVPLVMANNTIMLNVPFRDYQYQQAVARTDRYGQDEACFIWNVKLDTGAEPNISTRSHDIMNWSKQQVAEIMGTAIPEGMALEGFADKSVFDDITLEEFAEMEEYNSEFSGREDEQTPNKPTWYGW